MAQKELMIVNNIRRIEKGTKRKSPTIEIVLQYPRYLKAAQKVADDLVDKLLRQINGDKIKIKGLSLVWNEDE